MKILHKLPSFGKINPGLRKKACNLSILASHIINKSHAHVLYWYKYKSLYQWDNISFGTVQ